MVRIYCFRQCDDPSSLRCTVTTALSCIRPGTYLCRAGRRGLGRWGCCALAVANKWIILACGLRRPPNSGTLLDDWFGEGVVTIKPHRNFNKIAVHQPRDTHFLRYMWGDTCHVCLKGEQSVEPHTEDVRIKVAVSIGIPDKTKSPSGGVFEVLDLFINKALELLGFISMHQTTAPVINSN